MQLSREIRSINFFHLVRRGVYKSSFENLEDELTIVGKTKNKQKIIEYSNLEIVFEYSNGMRIFE